MAMDPYTPSALCGRPAAQVVSVVELHVEQRDGSYTDEVSPWGIDDEGAVHELFVCSGRLVESYGKGSVDCHQLHRVEHL